MDRSTRERLLDAGLRLFAERGFRGTTVGDIEAAAGLAPRSGALYKHFSSKRELLAAAVERYIHEVRTIGDVTALMPLGDVRAEMTLLARWVLQQLDREHDLVRVLEKEGDDLRELRDRVYAELVDEGYRLGVEYFRRVLERVEGLRDVDAEALSVVALGATAGFRRSEWTFGRRPLGLDDDRFVAALVDLLARLVETARARG
ncbi:MAG TPA: helix-turn-helix domain-containing protein [Actinomycetota bacterium]|nr:helix-turn-helix domain-containing protein [Actinomycetota bacterium]